MTCLLVGGPVTALSVTFCPVTAFVERVVLSIATLCTPDVVVALGNNYFLVCGEGDVGIGSADSFGCLMKLGAPFTVTSARVLGAVDDCIQFFLLLNGEEVLCHWVSLARFSLVTGYTRRIHSDDDECKYSLIRGEDEKLSRVKYDA